jgi:hypothetical protein
MSDTDRLLADLPNWSAAQLDRFAAEIDADDTMPGVTVTDDNVQVTDRDAFIRAMRERNGN